MFSFIYAEHRCFVVVLFEQAAESYNIHLFWTTLLRH